MSLENHLKIDSPKVATDIENLIKEKMVSLKREGVIIGLSGGLDSAVAAGLLSRAVGKDKVRALIMPEKDSAPRSKKDAQMVASHYGIKTEIIDLTPYLKLFGIYRLLPTKFLPKIFQAKLVRKFYELYYKKTGETFFQTQLLGTSGYPYQGWLNKSSAYYRAKHRLRMVLLYREAELNNLLFISSANKTEWLTGFFVKWGCDGVGDVAPLMGLYKTQVRELARFLEVPEKIIDKTPSPDMMPGITDEYAMGITYDRLDLILVGIEKKLSLAEIASQAGIEKKTVEYVNELYKRSEHMRKVYTLRVLNNYETLSSRA